MGQTIKPCGTLWKQQKFPFPIRSIGAESGLCNKGVVRSRVNLIRDWSFIKGSRVFVRQKAMRLAPCRKAGRVYASCNPFLSVCIIKLLYYFHVANDFTYNLCSEFLLLCYIVFVAILLCCESINTPDIIKRYFYD